MHSASHSRYADYSVGRYDGSSTHASSLRSASSLGAPASDGSPSVSGFSYTGAVSGGAYDGSFAGRSASADAYSEHFAGAFATRGSYFVRAGDGSSFDLTRPSGYAAYGCYLPSPYKRIDASSAPAGSSLTSSGSYECHSAESANSDEHFVSSGATFGSASASSSTGAASNGTSVESP